MSTNHGKFPSAQESFFHHQSSGSLILEVDAIKVEDPSPECELPENAVSDEETIPTAASQHLVTFVKHETIKEAASPVQEVVASGSLTLFF